MATSDKMRQRLTQAGAKIEYIHGLGWRFCLGMSVCEQVSQLDVARLIMHRHLVLVCVRPFPTYVLDMQDSGVKHGPQRVSAVAYQMRAC